MIPVATAIKGVISGSYQISCDYLGLKLMVPFVSFQVLTASG